MNTIDRKDGWHRVRLALRSDNLDALNSAHQWLCDRLREDDYTSLWSVVVVIVVRAICTIMAAVSSWVIAYGVCYWIYWVINGSNLLDATRPVWWSVVAPALCGCGAIAGTCVHLHRCAPLSVTGDTPYYLIIRLRLKHVLKRMLKLLAAETAATANKLEKFEAVAKEKGVDLDQEYGLDALITVLKRAWGIIASIVGGFIAMTMWLAFCLIVGENLPSTTVEAIFVAVSIPACICVSIETFCVPIAADSGLFCAFDNFIASQESSACARQMFALRREIARCEIEGAPHRRWRVKR